MARRSAGILSCRRRGTAVKLLLVHPGGPQLARKDGGDLVALGEVRQRGGKVCRPAPACRAFD
jgi:predicted NUDIX family NTP pyrophosphohydrolase